jgi:hypothetical protein
LSFHFQDVTYESLDDIYCSNFSTGCNPNVLGWRPQPCISFLQLDVGCSVVIAAAISDAMLLPTDDCFAQDVPEPVCDGLTCPKFLNCEAQYLKWTCFTAKPGLVILWLNIYYINIFIDFYSGFLQHLECPNRSPLRSWDYMVSNLVILVVSFVISKKTLGCLTFFLCVVGERSRYTWFNSFTSNLSSKFRL